MEKFALGFTSDVDFDDPEILTELGLEIDLPRLHRASLKLLKQAWNRCAQQCNGEIMGSSDKSAHPKASSTSGLSILIHQKDLGVNLSGGQVISAMKKKFARSYPAKPLTPETMPSQRLLALVHQSITKSHWKWIPWKYRMSLHRQDELQSSRSSKVPKLENLTLHNILLDEVPSIDIGNTIIGLHALRVTFDVYNNAVALCEGAYLANVKDYSMKFLSLLTTKYDAESGLRSPTITEAQNADKMISSIMMELINDRGWSHDQAPHEITHMRSELTTYLQPRPRVSKPATPNDKGSFKGWPIKGGGKPPKGGGKSKTKDNGKGKSKTTWVSEICINGEWKSLCLCYLCLCYQSGKCNFSDCRFVHARAHPKPDGTACGGKRAAMEHSSTPH